METAVAALAIGILSILFFNGSNPKEEKKPLPSPPEPEYEIIIRPKKK